MQKPKTKTAATKTTKAPPEDPAVRRLRRAALKAVKAERRELQFEYRNMFEDLRIAAAAEALRRFDEAAPWMPTVPLSAAGSARDVMRKAPVIRAKRRRLTNAIVSLSNDSFSPKSFLEYVEAGYDNATGYSLDEDRAELQSLLEVLAFYKNNKHCRAYLTIGQFERAKSIINDRANEAVKQVRAGPKPR